MLSLLEHLTDVRGRKFVPCRNAQCCQLGLGRAGSSLVSGNAKGPSYPLGDGSALPSRGQTDLFQFVIVKHHL